MMDLMPVYRRLSSEQVDSFRPWYQWSLVRIGWAFLLAMVGARWVTR